MSLANSAAGPHALEVSDETIDHLNFNHISGVRSVDGLRTYSRYDYQNPFLAMETMGRRSMQQTSINENFSSDDDSAFCAINGEADDETMRLRRLSQMTEEEAWQIGTKNVGLKELLDKEKTVFSGIGVMSAKLSDYMNVVNAKCSGKFPPMNDWSSSDNDHEVGMQLRAAAILLANGIYPKVYQIHQTRYDTHSNQHQVLGVLLSALRNAVSTFIKAAEVCGFWEDVLVATFTDFGRRMEQNSRYDLADFSVLASRVKTQKNSKINPGVLVVMGREGSSHSMWYSLVMSRGRGART